MRTLLDLQRGLWLLTKRIRPLIGIAIWTLIAPGVFAQSPTDTFIRLHWQEGISLRASTTPPQQKHFVLLTSRGGVIRSRVSLTSTTESEAKRKARHDAYLAALQAAMPNDSTREIAVLRRNVESAVADLDSATANLLAFHKVADGFEAQAEVARPVSELLSDFRNLGLSSRRVLVFLDSPENAQINHSPVAVETEAIEGALADNGFTVFDRNYLMEQRSVNLSSMAKANLYDESSLLKMSVASLCGTLVLGSVDLQPSQNSEGIVSATASLRLRVVNGTSGQVVVTRTYREKGFGVSLDQAEESALATLAKRIASDLPNEITKRLQQHHTTILFAGSGVGADTRVEAVLRRMPGVTNVLRDKTGIHPRLFVDTTETPAYFGLQLVKDLGAESFDLGVGPTHEEKP